MQRELEEARAEVDECEGVLKVWRRRATEAGEALDAAIAEGGRGAVLRLIRAAAEEGFDFGFWSDLSKLTPEFRYECRIFNGDLRVRATGANANQAAARAYNELRERQAVPASPSPQPGKGDEQ